MDGKESGRILEAIDTLKSEVYELSHKVDCLEAKFNRGIGVVVGFFIAVGGGAAAVGKWLAGR